MRFEKWQALGNDYLVVEARELPFELTPARVRRLCEGHLGVHADGVLLLGPPASAEHVAELRIFNPDGSEAELSGNGAREAVLYLRRRGWTESDSFAVGTAAGTIRPRITGLDTCSVEMGVASLTSRDYPHGPPDGRGELVADGRKWRFQHVSIGNPQCAIRVASPIELAALDLPSIGPPIEGHELFPNRTNVSWWTVVDTGPDGRSGRRIRARIFERGVGETLSSGTGASGAALASLLDVAAEASRTPDSATGTVTVELDGGSLEVTVGQGLSIDLAGWAKPVFEGRLSEDFEKELHETE